VCYAATAAAAIRLERCTVWVCLLVLLVLQLCLALLDTQIMAQTALLDHLQHCRADVCRQNVTQSSKQSERDSISTAVIVDALHA
jgi:hypothetical protein